MSSPWQPTPDVVLIVHPIDTATHPDIVAGWRWAAQVGGTGPTNVDWCANAGWAPTERAAQADGERCVATAIRALRMLGVPAGPLRVIRLDHDPIPAGPGQLHTIDQGEEH